jgi:hypothetical protein
MVHHVLGVLLVFLQNKRYLSRISIGHPYHIYIPSVLLVSTVYHIHCTIGVLCGVYPWYAVSSQCPIDVHIAEVWFMVSRMDTK